MQRSVRIESCPICGKLPEYIELDVQLNTKRTEYSLYCGDSVHEIGVEGYDKHELMTRWNSSLRPSLKKLITYYIRKIGEKSQNRKGK